MSAKKHPRRPLPEPVTRSGVDIGFKPLGGPSKSGLYYHDKDENRFYPLYPSIYSTDAGNYFPLYDHFTREYIIARPLITRDQFAVYTFLASIRNQGFRVSIMGSRSKSGDDDEPTGLAALLGMGRPQLIQALDHLEDCLLIHRVRRLDIHGTPNDILIHTPFTRQQLYGGQRFIDIIEDRIARKVTATARQKKMVTGVTDDGQPYSYLDRTVGTDGRFHYNASQISEAFGFYTDKFTQFALKYFRKNHHLLRGDKSGFEHDYREDLSLELNLYEIHKDAAREKCYRAAHKFRTIYCPSHEELLAI